MHFISRLAQCALLLCMACVGIFVLRYWIKCKQEEFVFFTEYFADLIKAQKRLINGSSQKCIVDGPATRFLANLKLFLTNEDNKRELCQFLLYG